MTITHFSALPLLDQLDLLHSEGVHLAKRYHNNTPVILYQLGKWYVEIFYRSYRIEVSHIICTASTDLLTPYLEHICLKELLN